MVKLKGINTQKKELNLLVETLKDKKLITNNDLTTTQKKLKNDKK